MTEMIERVAKAIREHEAYWWNRSDEPEDGLAETLARAAIEAMREPTEMMGAAGLMASSHDPLGGNEKLSDEDAEKIGWTDRLRANPLRWEMPVWRAMVDAALGDQR